MIRDVTEENVEDLCRICISPAERNNPDYIKGVEEKIKWALEMLKKWGSFAKIDYQDDIPVGFIQYKPIPSERVVYIDCIFVPWNKYWNKGIGSELLSSLMEDMRKPLIYFDSNFSLALVTKTFPGGAPGQCSARLFFTKKGFRQVGEDPDFLYYPLEKGFTYVPIIERRSEYIPKEGDKGKVLIVCGPNNCPVTYSFFLKRMEKYIREVDSEVPILWVDVSEEPQEVRNRNIDVGDCVVNANLIKSFVLDKESFQGEIKRALKL